MTLRITFLAANIAGIFIQVASGNELDFDSPEGALRHDMSILAADVRNSALAGYKRRFTLTDDEFSDQLVKLATVATNGEEATLRMFTVAALGDFGTTNALIFLENEALKGWASGGISGYGLITGFDHRFFSLAEQMLADKSNENWGRRDPVYRVFETILCSNSCRGTTISETTKAKARKALKVHSISDSYHRVLIDMILAENDFEVPSYKNSPERLQIARVACDDPASSDYAQGYFKNVLQQIGYALPKAEEGNSPKAASRETGKQTGGELAEPTSGRCGDKKDGLTSSETVDADTPSIHTCLYIVIGGVLLLA